MSCRYEKEASLLIEALNAQGVSFAIGLSDAEAGEVECVFGFQFPPDLKALLQQALPISSGFVDWRAAMGSKKARRQIAERMAAPLEGILFDIKHNDYWLDSWGSRPAVFSERKARVEQPGGRCAKAYTSLFSPLPARYALRGGESGVFCLSDGHYLLRQRSGVLFCCGVWFYATGGVSSR